MPDPGQLLVRLPDLGIGGRRFQTEDRVGAAGHGTVLERKQANMKFIASPYGGLKDSRLTDYMDGQAKTNDDLRTLRNLRS